MTLDTKANQQDAKNKIITEFLSESAKQYILNYPERLSEFLAEFEADEIDFIERDLEYFENTVYDLKNSEHSHDGFSTSGYGNFSLAYDLVSKIGWEKFYYSTKRKIEFLNSKKFHPSETPATISPEPKYRAKHYVLAYLFDCIVAGEHYPIGNKKRLEQIGDLKMGFGKGNTFYKNFNLIVNEDLNSKRFLEELGGENWRQLVVELSTTPLLVDQYLKSKHL